MKKIVVTIFLAGVIFLSFFVFHSCKKDSDDIPSEVHDLTFKLPGIEFKHDTYYSVDDNIGHFDFVFNKDIDNYTDPFSYNGAKAMFSNTIEQQWNTTQIQNKVPVPLSVSESIAASLNLFDLYLVAIEEYT